MSAKQARTVHVFIQIYIFFCDDISNIAKLYKNKIYGYVSFFCITRCFISLQQTQNSYRLRQTRCWNVSHVRVMLYRAPCEAAHSALSAG
ncbi:hypothetical protein XELAEV_18035577mg [Xenopus laevis]|uniref:Uncharacterized protein n=1 Tax=Xenopus laevis TaxID=8355 RepID=A0A974CI59_XENLA|nr:hypothetical protein XELAEV_18035577mg [Xenopus laevis]